MSGTPTSYPSGETDNSASIGGESPPKRCRSPDTCRGYGVALPLSLFSRWAATWEARETENQRRYGTGHFGGPLGMTELRMGNRCVRGAIAAVAHMHSQPGPW